MQRNCATSRYHHSLVILTFGSFGWCWRKSQAGLRFFRIEPLHLTNDDAALEEAERQWQSTILMGEGKKQKANKEDEYRKIELEREL